MGGPATEAELDDSRRPSHLAEELERKSRGVIDPRSSKFIGFWDTLAAIALLFVAIVTPFEVALLDPHLDALFIVNRVVDLVFIVDLAVQFSLMYETASEQRGRRWVADRRLIALRYARTWLFVDVVSVLVSGVDVYEVAVDRLYPEQQPTLVDGEWVGGVANPVKQVRACVLLKQKRACAARARARAPPVRPRLRPPPLPPRGRCACSRCCACCGWSSSCGCCAPRGRSSGGRLDSASTTQ